MAPLAESVPPKFYGGTERVVSWLTEELISLGHEVMLFASGEALQALGRIKRTRAQHCAANSKTASPRAKWPRT